MSEGGAAGLLPVTGVLTRSCSVLRVVLRSLCRNRIADAVFGIEPVCRRRLKAAAERDEKILCDVVRREAEFLGLCALDSHMQYGSSNGCWIRRSTAPGT